MLVFHIYGLNALPIIELALFVLINTIAMILCWMLVNLDTLFSSFTLVVLARVLNIILSFFFVTGLGNKQVHWIFQPEYLRNLCIDYDFLRSGMLELDVLTDTCL